LWRGKQRTFYLELLFFRTAILHAAIKAVLLEAARESNCDENYGKHKPITTPTGQVSQASAPHK
jgi:hypothetical protein